MAAANPALPQSGTDATAAPAQPAQTPATGDAQKPPMGADAAAELLRRVIASDAAPAPAPSSASTSTPTSTPTLTPVPAPSGQPSTSPEFDLNSITFDGEEPAAASPAEPPVDDLDPDVLVSATDQSAQSPEAAETREAEQTPEKPADPAGQDRLSRKEANRIMGAFLRTPRGREMHGAFKLLQTLQSAGIDLGVNGTTVEELQQNATRAAAALRGAISAQQDWLTFQRDLQEAPERAAQFLFTGFQARDGRFVPPAVSQEFVSRLPAFLAEANPVAFQTLSAPIMEHIVEGLFQEALDIKPVSKVHLDERIRLLEHALETERRLFPDRFVLNAENKWESRFRKFDAQGNMQIDQSQVPAESQPSIAMRPTAPSAAPASSRSGDPEAERYRQALEAERRANLNRANAQFDSAYNGLMEKAGRTLESDIQKVLAAFPAIAAYPATVKEALTNHLYDQVSAQVFNQQSQFQKELEKQINHARQNFLRTGSLDLTAPEGLLIRTIRQSLRSVGPNILKSIASQGATAQNTTPPPPARTEAATGSSGAMVQSGIPPADSGGNKRAEVVKQIMAQRLPGETPAEAASRALRASLAL